MKVLALNGSPRKSGNSSSLLKEFLNGATNIDSEITEIIADKADIKSCKGCLKCNVYKECVIKGDKWSQLSKSILEADTIVIASPIYFHHLPGSLKLIIDRFRSFVDVRVTEEGINHTPWQPWTKRFVLLLSLGSSSSDDAKPVIDLFRYMIEIMGKQNSLEVLTATRLQMNGQVKMNEQRLSGLYPRIGLSEHLAHNDYLRNQDFLKQAYKMGQQEPSN
jgi:NAD(P)H-dependent FMN reductase